MSRKVKINKNKKGDDIIIQLLSVINIKYKSIIIQNNYNINYYGYLFEYFIS